MLKKPVCVPLSKQREAGIHLSSGLFLIATGVGISVTCHLNINLSRTTNAATALEQQYRTNLPTSFGTTKLWSYETSNPSLPHPLHCVCRLGAGVSIPLGGTKGSDLHCPRGAGSGRMGPRPGPVLLHPTICTGWDQSSETVLRLLQLLAVLRSGPSGS